MFKSVLLPIQEYNGPMFGGDFNCALEPQLERSLISAPGRHDSLALQQILSRVQLSAVLDDDMEIAEEERVLQRFGRRLTLISKLCRAVVRQVHGWIDGL